MLNFRLPALETPIEPYPFVLLVDCPSLMDALVVEFFGLTKLAKEYPDEEGDPMA